LGTSFRHIRIDELESYGKSEAYLRLSSVPITFQRIVSHVRNPRAEASDVALILAENEKGELLGFIGLLPDLLFIPVKEKAYWISCWWIDQVKGKNVGVPLLLSAYKASHGKLLADSVPNTISIFKASRLFFVAEPKEGLRVFLRPCLQKLVERKKPDWQFEQLVRISDKVLNLLFSPFAWMIKTLQSSPLESKRLLLLDEEQGAFLQKHLQGGYFQRGTAEWNWIVKYPWLNDSRSPKSSLIAHYPFSYGVSHFQNHLFALYKNNTQVALLFLTERDRSVKLHYAYYDAQWREEIAHCIETLLYQLGASEFTTFDPLLKESLAKRFRVGYKHTIYYQYVWAKDLRLQNTTGLQFGDGDAIFT